MTRDRRPLVNPPLLIPPVVPNPALALSAIAIGVGAGYIGGWQWCPLTVLAVLIFAGVWRGLALLGYIAGALGTDGDDG